MGGRTDKDIGALGIIYARSYNANLPAGNISVDADTLMLRSGENTIGIQLLTLIQYRSASGGAERPPSLEVKALVWRCYLSEMND